MSDPKNIDDLIAGLAEEGCSKKSMGCPLKRLLPILIAIIIYMAIAVHFLGLRMGLEEKLSDPIFLIENILMLFIAVSASFAASYLCVPDMQGKTWLLTMPLTLFGVFLTWEIVRAFTEDMGLSHALWDHCIVNLAIMGLLPGFIMILFVRGGATTKPVLMAVMNILTITGFSYVGHRLTCGADHVAHSAIASLLPFILVGSGIALAARKIFKW